MSSKIAILLPDIRIGGVEKMSVILANEFDSMGYTCTLITLFRTDNIQFGLNPSVNVICLGVCRIYDAIWPLIRIMASRKYDVVLARMWPITVIAVLARVLSGSTTKVVVSDHTCLSVSIPRETSTPSWLASLSIRLCYRFAEARITPSTGIATDIARFAGLRRTMFDVIPNPACPSSDLRYINANRVAGTESPTSEDSVWKRRGSYRILSVSTFKAQKNIPLLLEAFKLVSETLPVSCELALVGSGPQYNEIMNLIQLYDIKDSVIMPGYTDPKPWLESASMFVLSSSWEGFANVLVEALYYELPIVSTDCPHGPSEILDNGKYGKLVEVGNVKAMADAICSTYVSRPLTVGHRSRALAFQAKRIARMYLSHMELR